MFVSKSARKADPLDILAVSVHGRLWEVIMLHS